MKVIAFDPGYGRLGIAILEKEEKGKETILFSECLETSAQDDLHQRLLVIGRRVRELVGEYQPDACAIEQLFFAKNTKTALAVSESRGVVVFQVSDNGLPVYEFTPNQIKLAVTGYGSANKTEVYTMVSRLIDLGDKKQDDEIDAIAVGLTFFASVKLL